MNWFSKWTSIFPLFIARKLKKIGQQKNLEEDHLVQDPAEAVQNISPKSILNFNSQLVFLNILQSIEPEVVNAGHDYGQPDSAATLLTSLNELGERQLVKVVKWAKGLPGREAGWSFEAVLNISSQRVIWESGYISKKHIEATTDKKCSDVKPDFLATWEQWKQAVNTDILPPFKSIQQRCW